MSAQRDRLIAEGLIRIADRCSEALAAADDRHFSQEGALNNITDINRLVWELRWEVGPSGGDSELDRDYLADIKEAQAAE
jgi:hypothetical protein